MSWIKPPATPTYVVQHLDEAVARAVACLQAAGITVRPEVIATARRAGSASPRSDNASP